PGLAEGLELDRRRDRLVHGPQLSTPRRTRTVTLGRGDLNVLPALTGSLARKYLARKGVVSWIDAPRRDREGRPPRHRRGRPRRRRRGPGRGPRRRPLPGAGRAPDRLEGGQRQWRPPDGRAAPVQRAGAGLRADGPPSPRHA